MLFRRAAQNGSTPEAEAQHMMEHNHAPEWMQEIRRNKALQTIATAATITDTDGETVDVSGVNADGTLADPEAEGDEESPESPSSPSSPESAESADSAEEPEASKEAEADGPEASESDDEATKK